MSNTAEMSALQRENALLRQRIYELEQQNQALQERVITPYDALQSHAFYTLAEHSPDAIAIASLDHTIIYMNTAARALGDLDDVLGMPVTELFSVEPAFLFACFEQVVAQGTWTGMLPCRRKDGSTFDGQLSATLICDTEGRPYAVAGIVRDMSDQVRLEHELRQNQTLLQGIIDNMPATLMVKDTTGRTLLVNRQFATMVGLTPECLLATPDEELYPPELVEAWRATEQHIIATGETMESEEVAPFEDGLRTLLSAKFPIYQEDGNILAIGGICTDITERVRLEEALRQSEIRAQTIINASTDTFALLDIDQVILAMNAPAIEQLDQRAEQVIGARFDEVFPSEVAQRRIAVNQQVIDTGQPARFEDEYDGHHYDTVVHPVVDERGNVTHLSLFARDITERVQVETALRKSEERYERAVAAGGVGVWEWNLQTNEFYLAPNLKAMLGYAEHEIANTLETWNQHVHPDDLERVMQEAAMCIEGTRSHFAIEHRMLHRDGSIRWIIVHGDLIHDETGNPCCMAGTDTDITERKRIEEALRTSEEKFRRFFEQSWDGLALADRHGTVLEWNQSLERIMGLKREDVVNRPIWETHFQVAPPEQRTPEMYDYLRSRSLTYLNKQDKAPIIEWTAHQMYHPDGTHRVINSLIFPIQTEQGLLFGSIRRDVTELKETEEQLRRSRDLLQRFLDHSPAAVYVKDTERRILLANQRCIDMYHLAPDQFVGKTEDELFAPDMVATWKATDQRIFETGEPIEREEATTGKDGEQIYLSIKFPIYDGTQTITAIGGITADITERKRLEAALRESEERYRSVVAAMQEGVVLQDTTGTVIACNASAERILGISATDLKGLSGAGPGWSIIREDGTPYAKDEYPPSVTLRTGHPSSNTIMGIKSPDDHVCWISVNSQPLIQPGETQPYAVVSSVADINERKRAEEALRTSEQRYRGLVESQFDPIVRLDSQGHYTFVNDAYCDLLGVSHSALIGTSFIPTLRLDSHTSGIAIESIKILATSPLRIYVEQHLHTRQGWRWLAWESYEIKDETGKIVETQAVGRDITDRKRMEESLEAALWQSQNLLQGFLDHSPAAIFVKDIAGRFVIANQHLATCLRRNLADVEGKHQADVLPPEVLADWNTQDQHVLATGEPIEVEAPMTSDNEPRTHLVIKFPLANADGHIYAIGGIATDISARKRTEDALRASERRFRAIFEHAGIGVVLADEGGHVLESNPAFQCFLGYSSDEMRMQHYIDFTYPEDLPAERRAFDRTIASGAESFQVEKRYIRRDGTLIWGRLITSIVRNQHGGMSFAIAMIEDISERKRAEQALHESQALLQSFLDHSPSVMIVKNMQGQFLMFNKLAAALIGREPATLIGQTVADIFPPDLATAIQSNDQQVLTSGQSLQFEEVVPVADGQQRIYFASKFPLYNAQGEIYAIGDISTDVTDRIQAQQALRESEERYRTVVTNAQVVLFALDANGVFTLSEGKGLEAIGLKPGQVVGQSVFDMYRDLPDWIEHAHRVLAGEELIWEGEVAGRRFETRLTPVYDEAGTLTRVIGLAVDMTERRQAESALHQSQVLLQNIVNNSSAAIYVKDTTGHYMLVNERTEFNLGYHRDQIIGKTDADLFPPEFAHFFRATERQVIVHGQAVEREEVVPQEDGLHTYLSVKFPIYDEQGTIYAVGGISTDITQRKQTEQSLETAYAYLADLNAHLTRNRDLLSALLDRLEDGLLLLDRQGTVRTANRALARMLDCTQEHLVGQDWATRYPTIAPSFPGEFALNPPPSGHARHENIRYCRADGTMAILNIQTITLLETDHTIDQVILHVVDVTETVQLQARMIENERFAASGRLAASVAHEINTPLQALQNSLDLARIASEHDRETFLRYAMEEIQRVGRIVSQLLDLYRPSAATPGPVDVNTLLERVLLLIGKRTRDQHVHVHRTMAEDLSPLWGRADELMQVFLNLLVNALDAMPEGGTLSIATSMKPMPKPESTAEQIRTAHGSPGSYLVIAVSDTGCGIEPERQQRIFEPFVTTRDNGTGLGLSIVTQIVRQHGGTITVQSQPGHGSTFTVTFDLEQTVLC